MCAEMQISVSVSADLLAWPMAGTHGWNPKSLGRPGAYNVEARFGSALDGEAMTDFKGIMPVLRVTDLERAVHWYGQLGFDLIWRAPNDGEGENCMLRGGQVSLMLSTGSHLGGTPSFTGTLYIDTAEVAALYRRLEGKVEMVWPLERMDYGTVEFGIRDPDGYVVAFAQHMEPQ